MNIEIKDLNEKLDMLEQRTKLVEEAVKDEYVIPFLQRIGYDKSTCLYNYEYKCCEGRVDIYIELNDRNEGIYIEVKHGNDIIQKDNIRQIAKYLNDENVTWGIIINGRECYLLNREIDTKNNKNGDALLDKVVLYCDLKKHEERIKYFSKEYIFDNKKTLFIKDIAQFKAYKNYKDWNVYFSALFGFFEYYSETLESDLVIYDIHPSIHLADIKECHLKKYITTLKPKSRNTEKLSANIVRSKCSYISAMFTEFEKRNLIKINNLRDVRTNIVKQLIQEGIVCESTEEKNYLTKENVDIIIRNYTKKPKKTNIKLIIFGLIAYYGFTKSEVVDFLSQSWEAVNFKNKTIEYKGVKRKLPKLLEDNFYNLKKVTGRRKSILGDRGERGKSISIDVVSAAFDEIKKIPDLPGKEKFIPEYTRKMFIKNLFTAGFSVEEISGYVGISVGSLEKILGKEQIAKVGFERWNLKNRKKPVHPFEEEFNSNYYCKIS